MKFFKTLFACQTRSKAFKFPDRMMQGWLCAVEQQLNKRTDLVWSIIHLRSFWRPFSATNL